MNNILQDLKKQFDQPNKITLEAGQGGLPCVQIKTSLASATVYLHGAHLTHFQPVHTRQPLLFMSHSSWFEANKPIRGGVPICFPWFGASATHSSLPAHGFARLLPWTLQAVDEQPDGSVRINLTLCDSPDTLAYWPYSFELAYCLTIGHTLTMSLAVRNTGSRPLTFEEALHTYFQVGDIHQATVSGLEDIAYFDKAPTADATMASPQSAKPITFTGETDRIYPHPGKAILHDPAFGRTITIDKSHSATTVVWNPWTTKAQAMPDFDDHRWPEMLCIETANAKSHAMTLAVGESHTMTAHIAVDNQ